MSPTRNSGQFLQAFISNRKTDFSHFDPSGECLTVAHTWALKPIRVPFSKVGFLPDPSTVGAHKLFNLHNKVCTSSQSCDLDSTPFGFILNLYFVEPCRLLPVTPARQIPSLLLAGEVTWADAGAGRGGDGCMMWGPRVAWLQRAEGGGGARGARRGWGKADTRRWVGWRVLYAADLLHRQLPR